MPPADETPRIKPDEDVPGGANGGGGAGSASTAAPPPPESAPKSRGPGMRKLETQLRETYETLAVVAVFPFDNLAGSLLHAKAGELAASWVDLAERDTRVKRTLERLMEATGWGGVVMAHAAIVIPVIANRGMLPDSVAGGAAMLTIMQHPETQQHFTHERWQQPENVNGHK
jgi:hypothetical protein